MRGRWLVLLVLVLLAGTSHGQSIDEPAATNVILTVQPTPVLAPGEEGNIQLELHNPYPWAMENASLFVEIYAFLHRSEESEIAGLSNPPSLGTEGRPSTRVEFATLADGARMNGTIAVVTSRQTPGGTAFTQGAYLLRLRLDFDYLGMHAVMVSPGFYTPEEWAFANREPTPQEQADYRFVGWSNYSFLGLVLGLPSIDGVLFDSGFGVKEPLPLWPFQLLAVGSGISIALAGYYYWRERQGGGKS